MNLFVRSVHHRSANYRAGLAAMGVAAAAAIVLATSLPANAATPPSVGLGTADSFNVLAHTTVTNTGNSVINSGDVGLDPGTSVVGFPPAIINNGVIHATDAQAEQAQADVTTAYNDAAGRSPDASNIIDLAGRVLVPGVYSGNALSLTGDLTLDGTASSVFIFQAASTLITGSASRVLFTGGANECNVFWKVGSSATLGSGSSFTGTILALASVTVNSGATITGRVFARTGAVTLDNNVITRSADCAARASTVASTPSTNPAHAAAVEAQRAEDARLEAARVEAARVEAARVEAARVEAARVEAARVEAARVEAARVAALQTTAGTLASTGVDPVPALTLGSGLLLAGSLLFVLRRRRQARHRG